MDGEEDISFVVRSYDPADCATCRRLFVDGLIGGKIPDFDVGTDLDDITKTYMKAGGHFWVAELAGAEKPGRIIGMIGVQQREEGTAEVRRLRVDEAFRRRGVGTELLDRALQFCQDGGHLKIILDTFMEREPAIRLFEKFRFRHARTRRMGEKDLLYFYLDLYGTSKQH